MTHFETYRRGDDKWGWRLLAVNGEEIASDAGQGFRDEFDARRAVRTVVLAIHDVVLDAFDDRTRRELDERPTLEIDPE